MKFGHLLRHLFDEFVRPDGGDVAWLCADCYAERGEVVHALYFAQTQAETCACCGVVVAIGKATAYAAWAVPERT